MAAENIAAISVTRSKRLPWVDARPQVRVELTRQRPLQQRFVEHARHGRDDAAEHFGTYHSLSKQSSLVWLGPSAWVERA